MSGMRATARKWERILSSLPPAKRRWAVAALVGWWLSPLTAWNDAFTNIPLAVGLAYLVAASGCDIEMKTLSVAAYVFTNLLGLALLWIGVGKLSFPRETRPTSRGWLLRALARTAVYAVLVYLAVWSIQKVAEF